MVRTGGTNRVRIGDLEPGCAELLTSGSGREAQRTELQSSPSVGSGERTRFVLAVIGFDPSRAPGSTSRARAIRAR